MTLWSAWGDCAFLNGIHSPSIVFISLVPRQEQGADFISFRLDSIRQISNLFELPSSIGESGPIIFLAPQRCLFDS